MSMKERGMKAFATQGLTEALFDCLSDSRQAELAGLVSESGEVSPDVRSLVAGIVQSHYAEIKATTEETDALESE
jgi:hypothetical protein